jgi:hypothetical protein
MHTHTNKQLVQELDRALTKQKLLTDKLVQKSRKHAHMYKKMMEKAYKEEREINEETRARSVSVLEQRVESLREDLRTSRKAATGRIRRAYAQDNFLSQYAKAMANVKQQAQEMADSQNSALKNHVSVSVCMFTQCVILPLESNSSSCCSHTGALDHSSRALDHSSRAALKRA